MSCAGHNFVGLRQEQRAAQQQPSVSIIPDFHLSEDEDELNEEIKDKRSHGAAEKSMKKQYKAQVQRCM
jgi:hypothetical protein